MIMVMIGISYSHKRRTKIQHLETPQPIPSLPFPSLPPFPSHHPCFPPHSDKIGDRIPGYVVYIYVGTYIHTCTYVPLLVGLGRYRRHVKIVGCVSCGNDRPIIDSRCTFLYFSHRL